MNDTSMSVRKECSPEFNEMVFDCLPFQDCRGLEITKSKELRALNEKKRKELKLFFETNSLCKLPKRDVGIPAKIPKIVILGFEGEGAESVYGVLEGGSATPLGGENRFENGGHVMIFRSKLRIDRPNPEFEKEFAILRPIFDKGGEAILVLVMNGSTMLDRVYDRYYLQFTLKRIKLLNPRRCILVLTHGTDLMAEEGSIGDHFEEMVVKGGPVGPLLCLVYPNIVVIETDDASFYRVNQQRYQLLSLASRLMIVNDSLPSS